jgi:methionyl-tRNA synthetase
MAVQGEDFMAEHIHVSVAWPYANGDLHVGHLAGAYLPADIFARYHRLKGNHVLMVSGSDSHGTPTSVEADKRATTPILLFEHYHERFLETQKAIGISYDLFTHTDTENHHRIAQARLPSDSCRIGLSRASARSVTIRTRAATSAITAAACWMRSI